MTRESQLAPLIPLRYDLARLKSGLAAGLANVVAPPYDVISPDDRAKLAARDPHNVVRLILPEGEMDAKYTHAAELLDAWRKDGALVRDLEPAFYRYEQTFVPPGGLMNHEARLPEGQPGSERASRVGFLGLVRLATYAEKTVLPHERTLSGPKEDRLKLFRATHTNLSPGFMIYSDPKRELDAAIATATPLTEFETPDGIIHKLGKITSADAIQKIADGASRAPLLIADGHHRYETALRMRDEMEAELVKNGKAPPPDAPANVAPHRFFMVFFANGDDPALRVFPTHRHLHDALEFSFDALLEKAKTLFDLKNLQGTADDFLKELFATRRASFVACAKDGRATLLTLKENADLAKHPILGVQIEQLRKTDVAILHGAILEAMCGISKEAQAAKTNLWYPQDAPGALADLRSGKGDCLFLMNPTPPSVVREVAEAGEVMPQKSTFFYPKVATGLTIHLLDPT
ncbi:MAG: DUF1015 domain-containing protein [Polyangiaceae bacterium]